MNHYTTIVLGGGPSGISCAEHLKNREIDYLIIERKEMLQAWRHERWDSFYLVTPNWMTNFPGLEDQIPYDNSYMSRAEILELLEDYLKRVNPNYVEHTQVERVNKVGDLYHLQTDGGEYWCENLIVATGLFNEPCIPNIRNQFPSQVKQIHSMAYTNPTELAKGSTLVVGSGRSGIQIAIEVNQDSEFPVYLAVGTLTPIPSVYKNINGVYWLNQLSGFSRGPSVLPYSAEDFKNEKIMHKFAQNLGTCQRSGVVLTGRLLGVEGSTVIFADNLKQNLKQAADVMQRVEGRIDDLIQERTLSVSDTLISLEFEQVDINLIQELTALDIDLDNIKNVIWCTGFKPNYDWLELDIFNDAGELELLDGVRTKERVSFCGMSLQTSGGEKSAFGVGLFAINESAERAVASLFDESSKSIRS